MLKRVQVQLVNGENVVELSRDGLKVVAAEDFVLVLHDIGMAEVRLDGRIRVPQRSAIGDILALDLTRSTGVHHLHVAPGHDYWFGSEDTKLRLDGIARMLRYLRDEGKGWSGQLLFTDGAYLRDPLVMYGWLDRHADRDLGAIESVALRPRWAPTWTETVTDHGSTRIAKRPTLALLRSRGKELLEESAQGTMAIGDKRYSPLRVVSRMPRQTLDTPANRRVVWLAVGLRQIAEDVARVAPPKEQERCRNWATRADAVVDRSALRTVRGTARPVTFAKTTVERIDPRYVATHEASLRLSDLTSWTASYERLRGYSYIKYSDEIYQAFVAYAFANALDLTPTSHVLGIQQPAFTSADWDLYFNCEPPLEVMRTWRSYSARPDGPRPDLLLVSRAGEVVLIDAKYRNDGARASESSYQELTAYMGGYALNNAVIAYPPSLGAVLELRRVDGQGRTMIELPVSPVDGIDEFLRKQVIDVVVRLAAPPSWRN